MHRIGVVACGALSMVISAPTLVQAQCAPDSPLQVHAMIDNSLSVRRSSERAGAGLEREVRDWLRDVGRSLRPDDQIHVYPLVDRLGATITPIDTVVVDVSRGRSEVPHRHVESAASQVVQDTGSASDISETLRAMRLRSVDRRRSCQAYLLFTDGALAPIQRGRFPDEEFRRLQEEVELWRESQMFLIAVGVHARAWPGYDSTYRWAGDVAPGKERGIEILRTAFDLVAETTSSPDSLARLLYFHSSSPFGRMHSRPDDRAPYYLNAPYMLYMIESDRGEIDPFRSCAAVVRRPGHSVSRFGSGCLHHLFNLPLHELPTDIANAGIRWRWVTRSELIADGTPSPLLSLAQLAVTRVDSTKLSFGCSSPPAKAMLYQHGWQVPPAEPTIEVVVTSRDNRQLVDTASLHPIPNTTCYGVHDLSNVSRRTSTARMVEIQFDFVDEAPPSHAYKIAFPRLDAQPAEVAIASRRLLGIGAWKSELDVWFVTGALSLPARVKRPRILLGDMWIDLSPQTLACTGEHVCYRFAAVLRQPPDPRASLVYLGGEAANMSPIPVAVQPPERWNSSSLVLSWRWILMGLGSSLLLTSMIWGARRLWPNWRLLWPVQNLGPKCWGPICFITTLISALAVAEWIYVAAQVPDSGPVILATAFKSSLALVFAFVGTPLAHAIFPEGQV